MGHYTHLSLSERRQLYVFLEMGLSISTIAQRLSRNRSTLYRELKRNLISTDYLPGLAHEKAAQRVRRNRHSKLQKNPFLYDYVIRHLKEGWSPEQISGRMKMENKKYYACHETIYQYIYRKGNKGLYQYLNYKKPKRRRQYARKQQKCRFGDIRLITQRPYEVSLRSHYGHWEGDTIQFRGTKKITVTTLLERKSRLVRLIKNENKFSDQVMKAIKEKFQHEDPKFFKTITFDQGTEFADYTQIEKYLECKAYYCEARSPWQKGGNENMNGRLRRYLPDDTPIQLIHQHQLDQLADKMNNVPRKCLGFKKPKELIFQYKRNFCRTWS